MSRILLKGGYIADPSQGLSDLGNIYIEDGTIKNAGREKSAKADLVLDCRGKVIAPGFIDIHMHEDPYCQQEDQFDGSIFRSMALMGVTTVLAGNCGENAEDPAVYLDHVDRLGAPVNVGMLAGHTWLRKKLGGYDKYKPVDEEIIKKMRDEAKRLLDSGCLGISFGLKYVPGTTEEEILPLASLCRQERKLLAVHIREDGEGVLQAVEEMAEIGRKTGVKIELSHIGSMAGYGQMKVFLEKIQTWRREGLDMMCDCYPYDTFSTAIGETTYDDGFLEHYQADYDKVLICSGKYRGCRCNQAIFEELRKEAPETYTVGCFMDQQDVDLALAAPFVMIGSDGTRCREEGHPRGAGTFPRIFCRYVKTGKMPLTEAVRKMTLLPAKQLNLEKKGSLRPGSDGDVTVIDLERIRDRADYDHPTRTPEGISYVILGGKLIAQEGRLIRADAGRAVRG